MAYGTEKGGSTTGPADVGVDTVAGTDYQRVKLVDGAEGGTDGIPGDANGLLVNLGANNDVTVTGSVTADLGANNDVTVTGTVTANLATGTNNIGDVDVLTIAAGNNNIGDVDVASIAAGDNNIGNVDVVTLPALVAGSANIGDVDVLTVPAPLSTAGHGTAAAALRVELPTDGTGVIATVGAVTAITNALPTGANAIGKLAANSGIDIGDVDVLSTPKAATATLTNVNDTNVSTTLLSANAARLGAMIYNDSTVTLYVKYGTTASATSFTVLMLAGTYFEFPDPIYSGRVDGIWASDASGAARITEMTA